MNTIIWCSLVVTKLNCIVLHYSINIINYRNNLCSFGLHYSIIIINNIVLYFSLC